MDELEMPHFEWVENNGVACVKVTVSREWMEECRRQAFGCLMWGVPFPMTYKPEASVPGFEVEILEEE